MSIGLAPKAAQVNAQLERCGKLADQRKACGSKCLHLLIDTQCEKESRNLSAPKDSISQPITAGIPAKGKHVSEALLGDRGALVGLAANRCQLPRGGDWSACRVRRLEGRQLRLVEAQ